MRRVTQATVTTGVLFALIAGGAPAASAAPPAASTDVTQATETATLDAAPGTLFYDV